MVLDPTRLKICKIEKLDPQIQDKIKMNSKQISNICIGDKIMKLLKGNI